MRGIFLYKPDRSRTTTHTKRAAPFGAALFLSRRGSTVRNAPPERQISERMRRRFRETTRSPCPPSRCTKNRRRNADCQRVLLDLVRACFEHTRG
jgi:hypothetical protein